jgi:hypothetical protein
MDGTGRLGLLHDQSAKRHFICRRHQQFAATRVRTSRRAYCGIHEALWAKETCLFERFDDIRYAIQREKSIKHWPRTWKVRLIHSLNPEWDDLYETLI